MNKVFKPDCYFCLYAFTYETCSKCLGTCQEVDANGGKYLYLNYIKSNPQEQLDRLHNLQLEGKQSIVIGGQGEAEVNVKDTPEQTLTNLCNVSEQCGYFTTTGKWMAHVKEIFIYNRAQYRLTYYHNVLDKIDKITETRTWDR